MGEIAELVKKIQAARHFYYNQVGTVDITDAEFDALIDRLEELAPDHYVLSEVGAAPLTSRIPLPVYAGSLNKLKDQASIGRMVDKFDCKTWVVMPKLDGISCILQFCKSGTIRAYRRGSGHFGCEITRGVENIPLPTCDKVFASPLFKNVEGDLFVRGELIANLKVCDEKNPRNWVNGKMTALTPDPELIKKYIDFVPYEFTTASGGQPKVSLQLAQLSKLFKTTFKPTSIKSPNLDTLNKTLVECKAAHPQYQCDGIVLFNDTDYERNSSKNPAYAFAFKGTDTDVAVATEVIGVEWSIGKDGLIKPVLKLTPIVVDNANISQCTGKNYRFLVDNKINVGAIVEIVRSGSVIPNVKSVITPSKLKLKQPENSKLSESGADLVYTGGVTDDMKISRTKRIIAALGLTSLLNKRVMDRLEEDGKFTFEELMDLSPKQLADVMKSEEKANRTFNLLHDETSEDKIVAALVASGDSGKGIGTTKLTQLLEHPEVFAHGFKTDIPGFGPAFVKTFNENRKAILKFIKMF